MCYNTNIKKETNCKITGGKFMYYEINVSYNGRHLFATAERSITTEQKAKEMYRLFLKNFPESEGYNINVTRWNKSGTPIEFD